MCVTSSSAGARITTRCGHTAHWPTTRLRHSPPGGQRPSAPSETKSGRAGKARNGRFTGVTHLSLLSAKTAGISGHNPTTQAESSTSTWYAFAGHVSRRRTLPHFGGVFGVQARGNLERLIVVVTAYIAFRHMNTAARERKKRKLVVTPTW